MPGLTCVLGRERADDLARTAAKPLLRIPWQTMELAPTRDAFSVSSWTAKVWGLPGRAKEECNTCRGSKRPTLFRKASFLSSSKAALPGGLRLFARLRGKDSNLDRVFS